MLNLKLNLKNKNKSITFSGKLYLHGKIWVLVMLILMH